MNVNSDDDAHTRATSSTAIAWARMPPPWPPYSSGNAQAREAGVAPRVPAAHGYSSRSSASAAFGAIVLLREPPHRRAQLDVLVGKHERQLTRPVAGRSCAGSGAQVEPGLRPRHPSTRVEPARSPRSAQERVGHRVDELAPAACSRARRRARARARSSTNCVVGAAVVAEERDRDVDVAHHRRPPERAPRACPRSRRSTRDHVVARARAATSAQPVARRGRRACRRSRRSGRAGPAARRRAWRPGSRSPGRSARQSPRRRVARARAAGSAAGAAGRRAPTARTDR